MSKAENIAVARKYWEELFSEGRMEVADQIGDPKWVIHNPDVPEGTKGPEGMKSLAMMYRTAFPDLRFNVEEVVAEGDKVVIRYTCGGTHLGPLMGIPPTGKHATGIAGVAIDRIANGKLVERWGNFDNLGILQAIGVIPAPGA